jgi:flagellin
MRINHNIAALNTYRQLSLNTTSGSKSLEKLSSGLRINRAGDDAAGLSISEKMRGQIRGLNQASRNAQDGISLIQTAEGALNETHAILQRMRELAVQASTDTNTLDDRKEIQKEINQLLEEIDRIADNTEFNTKKLINGDLAGTGSVSGSGEGTEASAATVTTAIGGVADFVINAGVENAELGNIDIAFTTGATAGAAFGADGTLTVTLDETKSDYDAASIAAIITGQDYSEDTNKPADLDMTKFTITGGGTVDATGTVDETATLEGGAAAGEADGSGATGATIASLKVDNVDTATTGGVLTQAGADAAITNINTAITQVSAERSKLGAYQNRLEHTIKNLDNSSENLQAAESRIRDVDMAKEMMEFTKNNILQQAAQAMLAQANMQPQGVLQLLR